MSKPEFKLVETPEYFTQLPALAERLGVKPVDHDASSGLVLLSMKDGTMYNVIELVNAVLDRIDAVEKLT